MSVDPNFNRQVEGMRGFSSIAEAATDPDGLPTIKTIQSMSKDDVTNTFDKLSTKSGSASLNFLAKTAVAAQKLGFDGPAGKPGRNLISKAVELYARDMGIDPLKATEENKTDCIKDLSMRAMAYMPGGEEGMADTKNLMGIAITAFTTWVMYEQTMDHVRRG